MLADYVNKIFNDNDLAKLLSQNARERASISRDRDTNYDRNNRDL